MFQGSAYQQAHKQVNPQAFSRCSCFLPSFLLHCSRSFLRPPFFAGKISAYFMELGAFCSGLLFLLRKAGSCLFLAVLYGCLAKLSWTYCFLESPCGFWSYFAGPFAVLQVGSILAPAALFAGHFFWLKKSIFCIKCSILGNRILQAHWQCTRRMDNPAQAEKRSQKKPPAAASREEALKEWN